MAVPSIVVIYSWWLVRVTWGALKSKKSLGVVSTRRHTLFYCAWRYASQMLCVLQIEGKTFHQHKDYDSLYCDTNFIVVVWNQTGNISEVCLYFINAPQMILMSPKVRDWQIKAPGPIRSKTNFCKFYLEHRHMHMCLWPLLSNSRIQYLWQRLYGPESLKYLPSGRLQKKLASSNPDHFLLSLPFVNSIDSIKNCWL